MQHIDDALDDVSGCNLFSTVDLASGFWQVRMSEESKPKTAFQTKRGQYQFRVMAFGLCNAPATFQKLMNKVLNGLMPVYLDDVINALMTIR